MFAMNYPMLRWLPAPILVVSILSSNPLTARPSGAELARSPLPTVIVIGFVGGFVRHNNTIHQEVQVATRLRKDYPRVDVRIFANHLARKAHEEILRSLDADHNGTLSAREKLDARIVLYGHSWGASEAVTMARTLQKDGVPVMLTIQVDSITKPGEEDRYIPANVAQAINFYQRAGLFHGQRRILAVDPARTQILGNVQLDYSNRQINCDGYPWYARIFMRPHIEIESDPGLWNRVESLIRSKL